MGKKRILHIAAHMGEGAGKAISGLAISDLENDHEIVLLEKPNKTNYIDYCIQNGVSIIISPDNDKLIQLVNASDVVILNWWNHPSMIPILYRLSKLPSRMLLWSHVNGWTYPQLSSKFASIFDECLFTSPISLKPPHWTEHEISCIGAKSEIVYGMGDFKPQENPYKKSYEIHNPIRIGYIGTLDFSKMHPEYLNYCKAIVDRGINATFVLAGEPSQLLIENIEKNNLLDRFELLGFRRDILELLTTFDIFGYLLNPDNFATTENALLEAMSAGLPIITGYSEAEKAIISNGTDGFCVNNIEQYADRIEQLINDINLRNRIGTAARESVCNKYSLDKNIERFNASIERVMKKGKMIHDFYCADGETPFDYFLMSCPENVREVFRAAAECQNDRRFKELKEVASSFGEVFKSNRKGSAFQFSSYFTSDKKLDRVRELFESR